MGFENIAGQDFAVTYLKRAWKNGRIPHAFLFAGRRGVGKTSTARLMAMLKFCENPDTAKVDPCGVCPGCRAVQAGDHPDFCQMLSDETEKEIRIGDKSKLIPPSDPQKLVYPEYMVELLYSLQRRSAMGKGKFVLIQNSEKMNASSSNSLLKSIEEPSEETQFILTTENLSANLPTIISRCHVIRFRDIAPETVENILARKENIPPEAARKAALLSHGSVTRAEEILEKNILPVRAWLCEEMGCISEWDVFAFSEKLRSLAPGMIFGFSRDGEALSPPKGESRTQHPNRMGMKMLMEMMLEYLRDISVQRSGQEGILRFYPDHVFNETEMNYSDEHIAAAQDDILNSCYSIERNVNIEMVVDNLLTKLQTRFMGAGSC